MQGKGLIMKDGVKPFDEVTLIAEGDTGYEDLKVITNILNKHEAGKLPLEAFPNKIGL